MDWYGPILTPHTLPLQTHMPLGKRELGPMEHNCSSLEVVGGGRFKVTLPLLRVASLCLLRGGEEGAHWGDTKQTLGFQWGPVGSGR